MKRATSIFLERAEGLASECYAVTVTTWDAATAILQRWARTAPERGYDKCDFRVTYEDGETYSGRFDLQRRHSTGLELLERHMRDHLQFCSGAWCPAHMGREEYEQFLERRPDVRESARQFLESYQIGA